jgi:hypothetical protein
MHDYDTGATTAQNITVLRWREQCVHTDGDGTNLDSAKEGGYPLRSVKRQQAHEITHTDIQFLKGIAYLIDFAGYFLERQVPFPAVESDFVGALGQIVLQNVYSIVIKW